MTSDLLKLWNGDFKLCNLLKDFEVHWLLECTISEHAHFFFLNLYSSCTSLGLVIKKNKKHLIFKKNPLVLHQKQVDCSCPACLSSFFCLFCLLYECLFHIFVACLWCHMHCIIWFRLLLWVEPFLALFHISNYTETKPATWSK